MTAMISRAWNCLQSRIHLKEITVVYHFMRTIIFLLWNLWRVAHPNSLKLSLGIIMPFRTFTRHPITPCSSCSSRQIAQFKGTCQRVLEIRRVLCSFSRFIRRRQPRAINWSHLRDQQPFRVLSTRAWMDQLVKQFLMVISLFNHSLRVF